MRAAIIFAALLLTPSPATSQVRDTARTANATGTATISGRVVNADAPDKGVRRVTVMLGAGDQIKVPINVVTDDAGRFSFTGLAAGTYTLVANRAAYVTSTYGAKTHGRAQGAPITLAAGQQVTGLVMPMIHGAAMSGTVRLPSGAPGANLEIMVLSVKNGPQRRLSPVLVPGRTDDRGMYRVFGLPPGEYVVRVEMGAAARFEQMRATTAAEIAWATTLPAAAAAAAPGMPAPAASLPPPPASSQPVAFTSVFYPGVVDAGAAVAVALSPGEDRTGIDIMGTLVPTATVSGRVLGVDGEVPAGLQIRLESTGGTGAGLSDLVNNLIGRANARITRDEFSIPNVPPGRYRVIARGKPATTTPAPARPTGAGVMDIMSMMGGGGAGLTLWADQIIEISGQDVGGLLLRLQPGLTVSGRIEFETTKPQPPDPSTARIGFNSASVDAGGSLMEAMAKIMTGTFGSAQKDGSFTVAGLLPDRYRLIFVPPNVMLPPPLMPVPPGGFVLKTATLNGTDIADVPMELKPGAEVKDLVVTFTDKVTKLSGVVEDQAGKPIIGFPIIVFSTDPAHWTFGSRRIAEARPASDGAYKVLGLPAGEYYVCALTDLDPNDLYDPAFLELLVSGSFKITLADGEQKTQNLKLGGGL